MDGVQGNKSKTISCLKVTKESTNKSTNKSISKEENMVFDDYYGPLIIDFKKDKHGQRTHTEQVKGKSKRHTNKSKNSSQLSSEYSESSWKRVNGKGKSKSKSKDRLDSFFGSPKGKQSKNLLQMPDFRKSKSRSHGGRLKSGSKSHSNLKISS